MVCVGATLAVALLKPCIAVYVGAYCIRPVNMLHYFVLAVFNTPLRLFKYKKNGLTLSVPKAVRIT